MWLHETARQCDAVGATIKLIITVSVNTLTQPASEQTWRVKVRYHVTADATTPQPPSVQPDAELELNRDTVQEITVTPPMIAMSTTRDAQQTVVVRDFRTKPFTIRGVTTTSPHMMATVTAATLENGVHDPGASDLEGVIPRSAGG